MNLSSSSLVFFLIVRFHRIILSHHALHKALEFVLVDCSVFISIEFVKHRFYMLFITLLIFIILTNLHEECSCLSVFEGTIFVSIISTEYFINSLVSCLFLRSLSFKSGFPFQNILFFFLCLLFKSLFLFFRLFFCESFGNLCSRFFFSFLFFES